MMAIGLATLLATFWGTANYLFPFYAHTYPFAWYGLIVFLDGLLWWRWKEGLILARPREFLTLLFWSAVFWFYFEIWNLHLKDWYFAGVPPEGPWAHVEAYLDFATVLPGMFLVYRLLCRLQIPGQVKTRATVKRSFRKTCLVIGCAMLVLPLLYPHWFFPFVWGALIFLLEPILARWGAASLLRDAEDGEWTTLVRLLIAGILCGGYWEFCNFWSLEKWVYTVPFFSQGKLLEMPYLGFLGFPPFCVECFVMTNAVYLLRGGRHWLPEAREKRRSGVTHKAAYGVLVLLGLAVSEWSFHQMNARTIDSRSESLQEILGDISLSEADALTKKGWRYPQDILDNWDKASTAITIPFRDAIHGRLALVSLVHMGSKNARLLEAAGIAVPGDLRQQQPDHLFAHLVTINQALALRKTPLVKRRVAAWIHAGTRQSLFY
ncbi:MAG: DUF4332 domain-containing protein [Thermodesulfobacteriota bacterium]|nr:DUF4332 domain-containing protein [Thermodesulfobacteriota bacterium]